jgi:hypothetical protein
MSHKHYIHYPNATLAITVCENHFQTPLAYHSITTACALHTVVDDQSVKI